MQRLVFEQLLVSRLRQAGLGVLLITHQLHFCAQADWVVVLAEGRQVQQGSFQQLLLQHGAAFEVMMRDYQEDEEEQQQEHARAPAAALQAATDSTALVSPRAKPPPLVPSSTEGDKLERVHLGSVSPRVWLD